MITFDHIRAAFKIAHFDAVSAQLHMSPVPRGLINRKPEKPRQAGVLILIYPDAEDDLNIVLTQRTNTLTSHRGQISFPGGRRDLDDQSFVHTALREACEEINLCDASQLTIAGMLNTCYIPPSHYDVHPVVATIDHQPTLQPNPHEVTEIIPMLLVELLSPSIKGTEIRQINNYPVRVPYYLVNEHKVWGATAIMLSELEARLRHVVPEPILEQIH